MLLCLYSYLLRATIIALYYALLYLRITCSPHLHTWLKRINDDDWVRIQRTQACRADRRISAPIVFVHECFKISLDHAKKSFYRSANAIFRKFGRVANEDVVLQLLSSKCLPSLLYGLEACPLVKSDMSSLYFVINRFFMKLFKANNLDVVKTFQQYFNFEMPSTLWTKHSASFENKFSSSENVFCKITRYSI